MTDPVDYGHAFEVQRNETLTKAIDFASAITIRSRDSRQNSHFEPPMSLSAPSAPHEERRQEVLRLLKTRDFVSVPELAETFGVSEVTVRNDLTELARLGLVARVRGGVRALQRGQSEVAFDLRLRIEAGRKQAIARAAAALVDEGEAVALDSSTTAYYLALELRAKHDLVVVTNGLLIAAALADAPGISVLVTGGMLRLSAMSLVGELGADGLSMTRINKGFFGARGVSLERGLMDLNPEEVRTKRAMADACEQVYGILDGTKWHRSALLSFASIGDLHGIVSDASAPATEVEAWRASGIEVILAEPSRSSAPAVPPRELRRRVNSNGNTA
jgi:DeoR/GlpR family transcriptional regulator of sugar metabolism